MFAFVPVVGPLLSILFGMGGLAAIFLVPPLVFPFNWILGVALLGIAF